jgi:hypothetical protein
MVRMLSGIWPCDIKKLCANHRCAVRLAFAAAPSGCAVGPSPHLKSGAQAHRLSITTTRGKSGTPSSLSGKSLMTMEGINDDDS